MQRSLRPSTLVPRGLVVDEVSSDGAGALITVRAIGSGSSCPECGRMSKRVHSRYRRHLADLPMAGKPVRLVVRARRFHCDTVVCGRRIFAERFEQNVLVPWARRTARLDHIVRHLGLALGGRPAASFARRLGQIAAGCACAVSDFRFPEDDWRAIAPNLAGWYDRFRRRPSMRATEPFETPFDPEDVALRAMAKEVKAVTAKSEKSEKSEKSGAA